MIEQILWLLSWPAFILVAWIFTRLVLRKFEQRGWRVEYRQRFIYAWPFGVWASIGPQFFADAGQTGTGIVFNTFDTLFYHSILAFQTSDQEWPARTPFIPTELSNGRRNMIDPAINYDMFVQFLQGYENYLWYSRLVPWNVDVPMELHFKDVPLFFLLMIDL